MKLSNKQRENYLNACGTLCPYCKSSDLKNNNIIRETLFAIGTTTCNNCHKKWHDIFKLVILETI